MTTIIEDVKLDFQDVLLLPKRSTLDSRSKVDLNREYKFKHSTASYNGVPVIAANMDTIGTIEMAKAFHPYKMSVALHKFYPVDKLVQFFNTKESEYTFYTTGITKEDLEKLCKVREKATLGAEMKICVDVANGYSRKLVHFVEELRSVLPHSLIMAGNVVTPDMVYDLLERGADIVKVGIGPGSVCTTRKITGVGYPQLSAIMECADAAHGADGHICGDGGITCPGDVVKAFAGGADFVMCGGIFAGHDECDGEVPGKRIRDSVISELERATLRWKDQRENTHQLISLPKGEKWVATFNSVGSVTNIKDLPLSAYQFPQDAKMKFYGMSSEEAMNKHYGGKADYRAGEGKVVEVPYKGPVKGTVEEILGGLRSACTYVGARQLKHLPKCATFVRVGRQLNNVFGQG